MKATQQVVIKPIDCFKAIIADVSFNNDATEKLIIQAMIPDDVLKVGSTFRIIAGGIGGSFSTAPTITFRVRIGPTSLAGTVPCSIVITPAISMSGKPWRFEAIITVRVNGTNGTVIGKGFLFSELASALPNPLKGCVVVTPVAVNTTITNLLELTAQFSAANAANTLTATNAVIEQV